VHSHIAFLCSIAIFISLSNFPSQSVIFKLVTPQSPIPVAAKYKSYVCGSLGASNASSSPAGGIDVALKKCSALRRTDLSSRGVLLIVCVCISVNMVSGNMNILHLKWLGRRGRIKKERKFSTVTKNLLMTTNLHTGQCSYNSYSVRWLKLYCHTSQQIRNFNSVAKSAAKTEHDETS
jgi:hypothetical protein